MMRVIRFPGRLLACVLFVAFALLHSNLFLSNSLFAQNINQLPHWGLPLGTLGVFYKEGVFHHRWSLRQKDLLEKKHWTIKALRASSSAKASPSGKDSDQRLVLDIACDHSSNCQEMPSLYGYISNNGSLSIDFYNTSLGKGLDQGLFNTKSLKKTAKSSAKLLETVDFFALEPNVVTIEFAFSQIVTIDAFYLLNATRLVIDVKKMRN